MMAVTSFMSVLLKARGSFDFAVRSDRKR